MSQVFALRDLADVLAAFPPASPTPQTPSILWHNETLRQSRSILDQFHRLLESPSRVDIPSLSAKLGVKDTTWILASQPLLYSSERKEIISTPEVTQLLELLSEQASQQFVYLKTFAAEQNLDSHSLKDLIKRQELQLYEDPTSKSHRTYVCGSSLLVSTKTRIQELLSNAGSEHKVDLSAALPTVPRFLVQRFAEEVSRLKSIAGTVRNGKTRVTFLSEAYEAHAREERAKTIARQFSKVLVETHRSGYHRVPEDTEDTPGLQKVFFERTKAGLDDGSFSLLSSQGRPIALAFTNRLEALLSELKTSAATLLESWKTVELDQARTQMLAESSSSPDFAALVLQDERHRTAIEQSLSTKLEDIESAELQRCMIAFNENVRIPVRLYLTGLNGVPEPGLRQRLDDFVFEFLRKDLIPGGIQMMQDRARFGKELDRFSQACMDAKTVSDVQAALKNFSRKQKLDNISEEQEKLAKKDILQSKARALKKMVRASDILQNLIWILLAQELDGIFISSGRDTTRMIKFYQTLGDAQKTALLLAWKDKFKDAQETRQDIEDMRIMAEEVVNRMVLQNGLHEDTNGTSEP